MSKLLNVSKDKLTTMYSDLASQNEYLELRYKDLDNKYSRIQSAVDKLMPLISSLVTAFLNIRAIIRIIRSLRQ